MCRKGQHKMPSERRIAAQSSAPESGTFTCIRMLSSCCVLLTSYFLIAAIGVAAAGLFMLGNGFQKVVHENEDGSFVLRVSSQ